MRRFSLVLTSLVASVMLVGAGSDSVRKPAEQAKAVDGSTPVERALPLLRTAPSNPEVTSPEQTEPTGVEPDHASAGAAAFQINWSSINSGGAIGASSANYKLGLSVGQSVAGAGSSTNYGAGIGFWYGIAGGGAVCAVTITGDVNLTGTLTSADIIYEVNFVFKGGATPNPCEAAGDVTCNGTVTSADIIYLVNHVFKGGPAPCDICAEIPALWACP